MPRVGDRLQITLPADHCREVGIAPGDEYCSFVADGRITIVRKTPGAAKGFLRHVAGDPVVSDEESLQDELDCSTRDQKSTLAFLRRTSDPRYSARKAGITSRASASWVPKARPPAK